MPGQDRRLSILAIEPYYGGSHRAFIDGWITASRHRFHLITMPARKWKWRMRGAAVWAADHLAQLPESARFDLIFTSDMLSVADLVALIPTRFGRTPIVCYFHENQLTYPLSPDDRRDYQYGLTNITSCLSADQVWFNSDFHRRSFLEAVHQLLARMPDCVPQRISDRILDRSLVLHPGVDLGDLYEPPDDKPTGPPVLLWNHRWEYDKNPEAFFFAVERLAEMGLDFRLMILGESFRTSPPAIEASRRRFADRIVSFGYLKDRAEYLTALGRADFVVSTAVHEFFGLSVVEAAAAGCWPVLPQRLAYPELIPGELHAAVFYESDTALSGFLADRLANPPTGPQIARLTDHALRFDWTVRARLFDAEALRVAS